MHGTFLKFQSLLPSTHIAIHKQLSCPEPHLSSVSPELPSALEKEAINGYTQPAELIA